MKKKLAAFLCGVMCMGTLAGCSTEEIAYLKMVNDLSDLQEQGRIVGTMQIDVDFDEMHKQAEELAKAHYDVVDFIVNENEDLNGQKSFAVDYEMNLDTKKVAYDLAFDVKYNGKTYDMGKISHTATSGMYISNELLLGLYELMDDLDVGEEATFKLSEEYAKEFKRIASKNEYIKLADAQEITGMDMKTAVSEQDVSEVIAAMMDFLQGTLNGFETGMVKSVSNGFEVSATGTEAAQVIVKLIKHIANNPDRVIAETEKLTNVAIERFGANPAEASAKQLEMKAAFEAVKEDKALYADLLKEVAAMIDAEAKEAAAAKLLKNISFKETLTKSGESYETTGLYALKNAGKEVVTVRTSTQITKSTNEISVPASYVELDVLRGEMNALEDKYNPVIGAEIDWGFEKGGTDAILYAVRKHYDESAMEWTNVVIKDGRAYVPLRLIAEKLGEEVGWENATKTPYVMQNAQRIDMKGLLQDGSAYVGIRDFEKLGYTVDYTVDEYGVREAKIMS